mgnify:CR=1 FL=1
MKKVDVSTKNMGSFAGKWVAINPKTDRIIAVGETLKDISTLVSGKVGDKDKIMAASYKVPRRDEGPYILIFSQ